MEMFSPLKWAAGELSNILVSIYNVFIPHSYTIYAILIFRRVVVLASHDMIKEALVKQAENFASRPRATRSNMYFMEFKDGKLIFHSRLS